MLKKLFSKDEIKDIVFNINLPEGITLASNPDKKNVRWVGNLSKGKNVICLYVKALKQGKWNVNAKVQTDGIIFKEIEMPLNVVEKQG